MLTFQLSGRIGHIEILSNGALCVAIDTGDSWVLCTCHDARICARIRRKLRSGDRAKFSGDIEPKLRGSSNRYEMQFIVKRFTRLR